MRLQLERVKLLLRETDFPLDQIADQGRLSLFAIHEPAVSPQGGDAAPASIVSATRTSEDGEMPGWLGQNAGMPQPP